MENRISKTIGSLIGQTHGVLNGMTNHGPALNITTTTPDGLRADLNALVQQQNTCNAARSELSRRRKTLRLLVAEAREFARLSREVLKPHLGKQHSARWIDTGFVNSFAVPRFTAPLLPVLSALAAYFTAHPERQVAALDILGSRATALFNAIGAAEGAVKTQQSTLASAVTTRNAHAATIRTKLRNIIKELSLRMGPMDERYIGFGLNRPGQRATPESPKNVEATILQPGLIAVKWDKAPRAAHYRVWKKVAGVDEEFVPVGSPKDCDFTLEGFPPNTEIEIAVSAVNTGGESARSVP